MSQSAIPYLALGAAASLALAGYNSSQMNTYYAAQGQIENLADCSSFSLSSFADPHIVGQVGSQAANVDTTSTNESNLTTIENTNDGATQISTTVEPGSTGSGPGKQKGYVPSNWDATATIQHAGSGANAWTLSTSEKNGVVTGTLVDSTGVHTMNTSSAGAAFSEPDGTEIVVAQSPATIAGQANVMTTSIHVLQKLNAGGYIDTTVYPNNPATNGAGLSVITQGRGNAVINGATAVEATGSEDADLPCISPPANQTSIDRTHSNSGSSMQSLQ